MEANWKAQRYKSILQNLEIDYSKKQYELSVIRAEMSHFIYQISDKVQLKWNDQIGELYYVEDCENYFINGKLDTERLETSSDLFV